MTKWIEPLLGFLQVQLGIEMPTLKRFVGSIFAVLVFVLIRYIISRAIRRKVQDVARQYITRKTSSYTLTFILLIVLIRIWLGGITGFVAYISILSAGLAIALKDPLTNLAGWFFIATRKPFVVGDRIQLGDHAGDVIDIRLFAFSLNEIKNWVDADQSTGRILHIPNGWVFSRTIANYTQGFNFVWHEIPVVVTFESNWRKAKEMLSDIAHAHTAIQSEDAARQVKRAAMQYLIFYQHLGPVVWTSVVDNGVRLTIRYLSEPRKRRSSENDIWEDILEAFQREQDIDFAYPTTRFYDSRPKDLPPHTAP